MTAFPPSERCSARCRRLRHRRITAPRNRNGPPIFRHPSRWRARTSRKLFAWSQEDFERVRLSENRRTEAFSGLRCAPDGGRSGTLLDEPATTECPDISLGARQVSSGHWNSPMASKASQGRGMFKRTGAYWRQAGWPLRSRSCSRSLSSIRRQPPSPLPQPSAPCLPCRRPPPPSLLLATPFKGESSSSYGRARWRQAGAGMREVALGGEGLVERGGCR